MSAFVVTNETMNRVVAAIATVTNATRIDTRYYDMHNDQHLAEFGEELFRLNTDAVNQRYHENDPAPYYRHRPVNDHPAALLKALHCLIYQCSEGNVPETQGYKLLVDASNRLARQIAREHPLYKTAPWD